MGMKVQGDPRRPEQVNKWAPPPSAKEEPSAAGTFLTIAASILGCAAIFLKNNSFAWGALLCCCGAFAHATTGQQLAKGHVATSTIFSGFALFQLYSAQLTHLRIEK